jgi:hypothetical protein
VVPSRARFRARSGERGRESAIYYGKNYYGKNYYGTNYYGTNDGTVPTQATLQTLVLRAPVPGRDVGGRRHQRHHLHPEQHQRLLAGP